LVDIAMSQATWRHRYTLRDYLDVEEVSVVRHELIDGEIVAMAGGTPEHAALASAISALLGGQLRGQPCRSYSADLRIRVLETGLATYADASVVCDPVERDPSSPTHVVNPRVIFEVLSPGTEDYDRGEKRQHYQRIEALRAYVLVAQDKRRVELWSRSTASGEWAYAVYRPGEQVPLESIGCRLDLNDLYSAAGVPATGS
jgi:Uma2 family endonuclease